MLGADPGFCQEGMSQESSGKLLVCQSSKLFAAGVLDRFNFGAVEVLRFSF